MDKRVFCGMLVAVILIVLCAGSARSEVLGIKRSSNKCVGLPPEGHVWLFEDKNFGGTCWTFFTGDPDNNLLDKFTYIVEDARDQVSSAKWYVWPGRRVKLKEREVKSMCCYAIWGVGQDSDFKDDCFGDCIDGYILEKGGAPHPSYCSSEDRKRCEEGGRSKGSCN